MTPKLLFFDIDGTLLDYTGKMPASAKEALRQAPADRGISCLTGCLRILTALSTVPVQE